jgi:hypothetical protein
LPHEIGRRLGVVRAKVVQVHQQARLAARQHCADRAVIAALEWRAPGRVQRRAPSARCRGMRCALSLRHAVRGPHPCLQGPSVRARRTCSAKSWKSRLCCACAMTTDCDAWADCVWGGGSGALASIPPWELLRSSRSRTSREPRSRHGLRGKASRLSEALLFLSF